MLKQVGLTEGDKIVVSGAFDLFATKGLPLPVAFQLMQDNDMVPSPIHFIDKARENGWNDKTIKTRFREAIQDSFGNKTWLKMEEKFEWCLKNSANP